MHFYQTVTFVKDSKRLTDMTEASLGCLKKVLCFICPLAASGVLYFTHERLPVRLFVTHLSSKLM